MLLIYTHKITSRLAYTVDLVFNDVLNVPFQLTEDVDYFHSYTEAKIAYTDVNVSSGIFLQSNTILFETDIKKNTLQSHGQYLNFPVFYKCNEHSFLPYDLFATVFYFVTRYEEYDSEVMDKHQRFKAEESLAFKYQVLKLPFLHYLIEDFAIKLQRQYPALIFKKRHFKFLSTIDIDNAFAYAGKGIFRNVAGLIKDLSSLRLFEVKLRLASNLDPKQDPYNTFDRINSISKENQSQLQYFVLIGDYSTYDKNPSYRNKEFRMLLKKLAEKFDIGLHPSYESYLNPEKIVMEKERLENIIGKPIVSARCHFLRVKFPQTYRTFLSAGIMDDYTMIYASQCGFRTGLCVPYKWFDLQKNEATNLTIHTSVVMEGVLRDYNQLDIEKAEEEVMKLLNEVKRFGGEFISIYHNDSFTATNTNWINLYKLMHSKSR